MATMHCPLPFLTVPPLSPVFSISNHHMAPTHPLSFQTPRRPGRHASRLTLLTRPPSRSARLSVDPSHSATLAVGTPLGRPVSLGHPRGRHASRSTRLTRPPLRSARLSVDPPHSAPLGVGMPLGRPFSLGHPRGRQASRSTLLTRPPSRSARLSVDASSSATLTVSYSVRISLPYYYSLRWTKAALGNGGLLTWIGPRGIQPTVNRPEPITSDP
ncbi:hypothetical protein CsSME_00038757 [Camellia sinensis var. sinensis]